MIPQDPQVARARSGNIGQRRSLFCFLLIDRVAQQLVEFVHVEADEVEVEVLRLESGEVQSQKFIVPTCVERKLVVGDDVRTLLRFTEMIEYYHRNLFEL